MDHGGRERGGDTRGQRVPERERERERGEDFPREKFSIVDNDVEFARSNGKFLLITCFVLAFTRQRERERERERESYLSCFV